MAIEGKRSLLGEYKIIDTKNPQNSKTFWGKNAQEDAKAYGKMLVEKQKKTLVEKQKKTPKLTEGEKKIQSQLKMGGYFKDPSTGVDTVDSLRAGGDFTPERFKKAKTPEALERQKGVLETSFQRLQDKKTDAENDLEEWTEKDQRDYDYYKSRLDEIRKQLGTYAPEAPKQSGDSGSGEPKKKKMGYWDRAEKETWIRTRSNEILAEGKLMYNPARKQAEEDWEKEHNKKDPARLFE